MMILDHLLQKGITTLHEMSDECLLFIGLNGFNKKALFFTILKPLIVFTRLIDCLFYWQRISHFKQVVMSQK